MIALQRSLEYISHVESEPLEILMVFRNKLGPEAQQLLTKGTKFDTVPYI